MMPKKCMADVPNNMGPMQHVGMARTNIAATSIKFMPMITQA